ncbi:MAG: PQQ-like beta-propeller repeat protein, partial [Verrucomicrobia bacterium]|nr:PQQ-like beta-propeller repeat protein [Verrucomicrobiota bacterium]
MKSLVIVIALAIVLMAGMAVAGPVGPAPMQGINAQNQCQSPAVYESSPNPVWVHVLPGETRCTPLIDADDNIYVTTTDSESATYVAFDTDGNVLWSLSTGQDWGTESQGCLGEVGGNVYWYVPVYQNEGAGKVWKLDVTNGDIVWELEIPTETVFSEARPPDLGGARMKMDANGDLYLQTCGSGFLYKIQDTGTSGSRVWGSLTGHLGLAEIALSPEEDAVYGFNVFNAISETDREKLWKLDADTGAVVWSVAVASQVNDPDWMAGVGGFPVVDDDGNIYITFTGHDGVDIYRATAKYDPDGVKVWETPETTGWYNTWEIGQNGMAFNLDQTRIYQFVQTRLFALDTATGAIIWQSEDFDMGNWNVGSGSYPLIGPTGKYYLGGLCWTPYDVFRFTDNGTSCSMDDWKSRTGGESSYSGGLSQDSNSDLIVPSSNNGGCSKLWNDAPPLTIIEPQEIGPLEKDIPAYGEWPYGRGYQVLYKGAEGAPVTFGVASGAFPPGVHITEDGYIRGTPTATGQYTVEVSANDTVTTATKTYVIDVNTADLQLGPGLPLASVGHAYDGGLWIIGGTAPYAVAVTAGKGDGGTGDGTLGTTGLTLN